MSLQNPMISLILGHNLQFDWPIWQTFGTNTNTSQR